ncbi:hypothetical protein LIER_41550 [Lithospermum erythrorhizon]|uniref:Uncharacterized protein n=1 Tax=Lithospermum erythrorhizon TaxID=34254 RepID=A0AAV3RCP6_LITER
MSVSHKGIFGRIYDTRERGYLSLNGFGVDREFQDRSTLFGCCFMGSSRLRIVCLNGGCVWILILLFVLLLRAKIIYSFSVVVQANSGGCFYRSLMPTEVVCVGRKKGGGVSLSRGSLSRRG